MKLLGVFRVVQIGSSLYVVVPQAAREKLLLKKGVELIAYLSSDGALVYRRPKVETVMPTLNPVC